MDTSNRRPASASSEPADVDAWWDMPPTPAPPKPDGRLALAIRYVEHPAVSWRELSGVLLLTALSDVTIYRGQGFTGYAMFFAAAPLIFELCKPRADRRGVWAGLLGGLLLLLAAKLVWSGSMGLVAMGAFLVTAFAMSAAGITPYVLEVFVFASQSLLAGYQGVARQLRFLRGISPRMRYAQGLNYGLPAVTVIVFGTLFLLANPDLLKSFSDHLSRMFTSARTWLVQFSPSPWEFGFWGLVMWIVAGLMRPVVAEAAPVTQGSRGPQVATESPLYEPFRNTLRLVTLLFAAYLLFEFKTLWGRVFPPGFYYSGYAHEGAAWLTVALLLATLILSLVFRGSMLDDPRLLRMRRLAVIWSVENLLLGIAVYHRLWIYVNYNGMTRMRMVGFFGITLVLVGFGLVLGKIAFRHDFLWLVRRQLWALVAAVYLFLLTPVDQLVVRYNVNRILKGESACSVQIAFHSMEPDGLALLTHLLECPDAVIREGAKARLARADSERAELGDESWTAYQGADRWLGQRLEATRIQWDAYQDPELRRQAWQAFREYAYRWY